MTTERAVRDAVERAAAAVAPVWPLHSSVAVNPLSGFEDRPFVEAVARGGALFDARGYPSAATLRRAWESGRVAPGHLREALAAHGYDEGADPETLLERVARTEATRDALAERSGGTPAGGTATDRVDRALTRWLARFLDEGRAEWPMPGRERGFYAAFRAVARHDRTLPDRDALAALPERPVAALGQLLADCPADRLDETVEHHLTALPGWTGLVKRRADGGGDWQAAAPVTLVEYLAVRLALARLFDAPVVPAERPGTDAGVAPGDDEGDARNGDGTGAVPLPAVWLTAWEATYREALVDAVADAGLAAAGNGRGSDGSPAAGGRGRESDADARENGRNGDGDGSSGPAAQLAFCIDTRSAVLRRHVEAAGPYETYGYAGFFGVPMRYEGYGAAVAVDACPPILEARHRVADRPVDEEDPRRVSHDRRSAVRRAGGALLESLTSNVATAFSFVESAGGGYGLALALRTLLPRRADALLAAVDDRVPSPDEFCAPTVAHDPAADGALPLGLTLAERVEYAAAAFELTGWREFARLAVFVGHAGRSANNPFAASLDCGACAGNPGGPNARVLAALCNDERVREGLRDRGIDVPADTLFLAGEHDTGTDEVTLYDGDVPASHRADLERLRAGLDEARAGAAAARAPALGADDATGVREAERRAADWAETRPEWGLAGNAGFVVGPRSLTAGLDLGGRSFLHSYDWRTDPDGDALAAIMTGPVVVAQWINGQYYFSTVDNAVYGSGSKVTHNPVGNVGVLQGNGGDLMTGLPSQSLVAADGTPYHQPLRLSTVVHAPVDCVTRVLRRHDGPRKLLDNDWLSLTVVDPERGHAALRYDGDLEWTTLRPGDPRADARTPTAETAETAATDD